MYITHKKAKMAKVRMLRPLGPPSSALPKAATLRLMMSKDRAITADMEKSMTLKPRDPAGTSNSVP